MVAVTAVVIAVALSPGVDLAVASMFYLGDRQFLGGDVKIVQLLRFILMSVYVAACLGVVAGLIVARMNRGMWLSLTFSQWLFFALCLGVGPGVVANLALKDQSGRARPSQIVELGGTKQFSAAFRAQQSMPAQLLFRQRRSLVDVRRVLCRRKYLAPPLARTCRRRPCGREALLA